MAVSSLDLRRGGSHDAQIHRKSAWTPRRSALDRHRHPRLGRNRRQYYGMAGGALMPIGLLFWVLMILWLIVGLGGRWLPAEHQKYSIVWNSVIIFVLFF